ncbi:related to ALO1-D-arabinono-1,4-lactone oxidase [Serendipita indica DSM 11827]|uniref:Related to ALO1-D-arabinono-1,4-lactone oxidase n=1 Tax=Serendipita indica (strain DSM 11827) TaxID=1109443 RepID=G4TTS0_SERID|nr:related to ALO1-D-arabinono-1,4-lactone oxidase [Serendipita indica DSM 11827]
MRKTGSQKPPHPTPALRGRSHATPAKRPTYVPSTQELPGITQRNLIRRLRGTRKHFLHCLKLQWPDHTFAPTLQTPVPIRGHAYLMQGYALRYSRCSPSPLLTSLTGQGAVYQHGKTLVMIYTPYLALFGIFLAHSRAEVVNTFDGPGFPTCANVAQILYPQSIEEVVSIVKNASATNTPVRALGGGHSWYNTSCSDDPRTIVFKTEYLNRISNLDMNAGTVDIEGGVTFLQLADWLHARNASIGYTLVNWNITIAGAIAMGAHRSSLREDSMVAAAAEALDIVNGKGELVHLTKDMTSDTWLAATTSLGLLGAIVKIKFKVRPDFKVYADQKILDEQDVMNGDIYGMISKYATANLWWWPGLKKFHYRYYDEISINDPGRSLQNTFSVSSFEASTATLLLEGGTSQAWLNSLAEKTFFAVWSLPNFRDNTTQLPILTWPTTGFAYPVLIGGLYPDQKPEWEMNLHGYTLELAFPVTIANKVLQRIRQLFDESEAQGFPMTSTYRSGINLKFGKAFPDLLSQVTLTDEADWSKGVMMYDHPSYRPKNGIRYNEPFYHNLAKTLISEFPCRPHWTKNSREVLNLVKEHGRVDAGHLQRFEAVRAQFDPQRIFKSVVGETFGM